MSYGVAPDCDEIEVTLIGPGFGECCLVHLGGGVWIVVDSCRDRSTGEPAALKYLRSIGIDPAVAVTMIVVTHYHDDHIRGLAELLENCKSATLCCPAAMDQREFKVRVGAFTPRVLGSTGAVTREIESMLAVVKRRHSRRGRYPIIKALADREILVLPSADSGHGLECRVHTLSPSDKDFDHSMEWLAKEYARMLEPKIRPPAINPNDFSVALMISIGKTGILLGSDLEAPSDSNRGWNAVLASKSRPQHISSVVKIPHHGSENAHSPGMWTKLLFDNPWAILAPYQLGGNVLPEDSDIARITSLTSRAYSTALRRHRKYKGNRDRSVEKTINESGIKIVKSEPPTGIVRLRSRSVNNLAPQNWELSHFDGACALADS